MKKLLLSLGALSAVVAPVAAVVACGSTDSDSTLDQAKAAALKNTTLTQEQKDAINGAKTMDALTTVLTEQTNAAGNAVEASEITDTATVLSPTEVATATVTKMLSDAGYSMTDAAKTELVAYLLKVSGDDVLTLGDAFAGIIDDDTLTGTHGNDDFAVVINGEAKDVIAPEKVTHEKQLLMIGGRTIGEIVGANSKGDTEDTVTQDEKFAYTQEGMKDAKFVIFLQNDGNSATLEVAQVLHNGEDSYVLDQPKANYADAKDSINFATESFKVTKDAA